MAWVKKILAFLRVTDAHDGRLSLSNISVIVVLTKIAFMPACSEMDIGALLVVLLNYAYKKRLASDAIKDADDMPEAVGALEHTVKTLSESAAGTSKAIEDLNAKVSKLGLAVGFRSNNGNGS